ncbi:hypothetical protein OAE47_02775, partial [Akkermansiaceae bacterium]|nr:hypothetical protein [Akkermansiaceae bacterium]
VNDNTKSIITKQIATMPIDGGTNWYPPLMMALHGTSPQPNIVYLLSDGLILRESHLRLRPMR